MEVHELIDSVHDKETFVEFIKALSNDFLSYQDEWENLTVDHYLESISAWMNDMSDEQYKKNMKMFEKNTETKIPENIPWRYIANIFFAGKFYE